MSLGMSLFLMDVVLGLAVVTLLMAIAYRAGASHTDRKYIQRGLQRQERANRIARNTRREYLETPITQTETDWPAWAREQVAEYHSRTGTPNQDMPTALLPQVGTTSEVEWRAHG